MLLTLLELQALRTLTADGRLLMLTRVVRLVAYGFLSVVFALYLAALGLTEQQIGLVLTLTLIGDAVLSLWIAMVADRLGRRRMLMLGAGLMVFAGLVFGVSAIPGHSLKVLYDLCRPMSARVSVTHLTSASLFLTRQGPSDAPSTRCKASSTLR